MYFQLILHRLLLIIVTEALIHATLALALGINCRGSIICGTMGHRDYVHRLQDIMRNGLDRSCMYPNGQHIACVSVGHGSKGVCAFLQGTSGGLQGENVIVLITYLASHQCDNCGSVPIGYPKSNDPVAGILTVNFVDDTANPCPNGVCFTCKPQKNVITA